MAKRRSPRTATTGKTVVDPRRKRVPRSAKRIVDPVFGPPLWVRSLVTTPRPTAVGIERMGKAVGQVMRPTRSA